MSFLESSFLLFLTAQPPGASWPLNLMFPFPVRLRRSNLATFFYITGVNWRSPSSSWGAGDLAPFQVSSSALASRVFPDL